MASEDQRRPRRIQESIRDILLRDWDPIGINDVPETTCLKRKMNMTRMSAAFTDCWLRIAPAIRSSTIWQISNRGQWNWAC